MKHLVLGIKPYDFVDDNGQRLQGVKIYYLDNHLENNANAKGYLPLNLTLVGGDHVDKFISVPGFYNLEFAMMPDKYGKPQIKLHGAAFVESVELPLD